MAAISHANIAAIYDWGEAPYGAASAAYVVIERLAGGSMRDMFDRGRRLTPSQTLVIGLDACRALDHAHRRGFVHGELTPSKLVFGDDRRLRIVDFGLAGLLGEQAWQEPVTVATHVAAYASPEQALSLPIDDKTDVYALCLVLVEAVTGSLPFAADSTVATLSARVGQLMPVSADLGSLAAVLEHAGRPEPEDRSTAAEFGRGLVQAAEKLPRPEPLPLLSSGMFDVPVEQLRNPDDPTGGVVRPGGSVDSWPGTQNPADVPTELLLIPLDEPDSGSQPGDLPGSGPSAGPLAHVAIDEQLGWDSSAADDELTIVPIDVDDDVGTGPPSAPDGSTGTAPDFEPFGAIPVVDRSDDLVILGGSNGSIGGAQRAIAAPDGGPGTWESEPATRTRRRVPWKLLLPLVVVVALVGLGVVAWQLFRTPVYAVPDLVGVEEPVARNQITGNAWEVSVKNERSDVEPRPGHVIRTAPAAGEELAEGEPFLLIVSDGPTFRELPELTGRPFADVETELAKLDLVVELVEQNDEVVPAGVIISWSVPDDPTLVAGSQVLPGRAVRVDLVDRSRSSNRSRSGRPHVHRRAGCSGAARARGDRGGARRSVTPSRSTRSSLRPGCWDTGRPRDRDRGRRVEGPRRGDDAEPGGHDVRRRVGHARRSRFRAGAHLRRNGRRVAVSHRCRGASRRWRRVPPRHAGRLGLPLITTVRPSGRQRRRLDRKDD